MNVRAILGAMLVLGMVGEVSHAEEPAGGSPLARMSLGTRGTSTGFMKRLEIMTRDGFSRRYPPLAAEVAVENLSRYDAIWAAVFLPAYNPPAWRLLRQKYPNILTLWYMSSDSTRVYDNGYFDYDYINTEHPEWFVLQDAKDPRRADPRDPDNRVRWTRRDPQAADYNRFYLDVGNPDFQQWATRQILNYVSGAAQGTTIPYRGLAADNVNIGARRMQTISNRHPNWTYANRFDDWNAGFCKYLRVVKDALNKRGFILVANHSLGYSSDADAQCWAAFLESVDGVMTEQSLGHAGHLYTGTAWLLSMNKHERILNKGLLDWWVCYPANDPAEGHEQFLYNYCSWLLVKRPGRSFFFATRNDPGWSNPVPPWYEEYDHPLGEPRSSRHRRDTCWVREYTNALVVVNPTRGMATVRFAGKDNWIESSTRQPCTTLVLPPASGRILIAKDGAPGGPRK